MSTNIKILVKVAHQFYSHCVSLSKILSKYSTKHLYIFIITETKRVKTSNFGNKTYQRHNIFLSFCQTNFHSISCHSFAFLCYRHVAHTPDTGEILPTLQIQHLILKLKKKIQTFTSFADSSLKRHIL